MDASDSSLSRLSLFLTLLLAVLAPQAHAYTVNPGTWSSTGSMTTPRVYHTATRLRSGKVLIVGGVSNISSGTPLASAELYDPVTGQFTATGDLHHARANHTATLMRDGRVLIDGGAHAPSEIYDPSTGQFTDTGTPLLNGCCRQRGRGSSALLPDGRVLVAFGNDGLGGPVTEAETYDPETGTYSTVNTDSTVCSGNGGVGIERARSAALNNGQVLLTGGDNAENGSGGSIDCAETYDPSTDTISSINPMTTDREEESSSLLGDGRVLISGGLSWCWPCHTPASYHGSAEIYEPRTGTFASTAAMTDSRYSHSSTLLPNGQVLVAGGANSAFLPPSNPPPAALPWVDLYTASSGSFVRTGSLPSGRYFHTAVLLPNGMTLVAGGLDASENVYGSAALYAPPNPVNIGAPQQGDVVAGSAVTVETEYNHPALVQWVNVYIDGNYVASPAQSFTWDASKYSNGPHLITAKGFNSGGSVVGTSAVTVKVANGPVSLFWPREKATLSHKVAVAATKLSSAQWINFYLDGNYKKSGPPMTIYWDSSTVANGTHTWSVKGYNSSGQQVGNDSVVINVLN